MCFKLIKPFDSRLQMYTPFGSRTGAFISWSALLYTFTLFDQLCFHFLPISNFSHIRMYLPSTTEKNLENIALDGSYWVKRDERLKETDWLYVFKWLVSQWVGLVLIKSTCRFACSWHGLQEAIKRGYSSKKCVLFKISCRFSSMRNYWLWDWQFKWDLSWIIHCPHLWCQH